MLSKWAFWGHELNPTNPFYRELFDHKSAVSITNRQKCPGNTPKICCKFTWTRAAVAIKLSTNGIIMQWLRSWFCQIYEYAFYGHLKYSPPFAFGPSPHPLCSRHQSSRICSGSGSGSSSGSGSVALGSIRPLHWDLFGRCMRCIGVGWLMGAKIGVATSCPSGTACGHPCRS